MNLKNILLANLLFSFSLFGQESFAPQVRFSTNLGEFTIELDRLRAPITVQNFIDYVDNEYYQDVLFHRVVHGFVVQAGAVSSDMTTKTAEQNVINESGNGLSNVRGSVGMARTQDPHSGNAQFYVNLSDNFALDPSPTRWGYAVFGRVISGMDIIDLIGERQTGAGGPFASDVPMDPVIIIEAEVLRY